MRFPVLGLMMINFLLSRCQYCGSPAKGRFYNLMLISTPFVLFFYLLVIGASAWFAINGTDTDPGFTMAGLIASIVMILIFLVPGLVMLYFLKKPKTTCNSCEQRAKMGAIEAERIRYETMRAQQEEMDRARAVAENEARLRREHAEMVAINEKLDTHPAVKEIIHRNSAQIKKLSIGLVDAVINATNLEKSGNFEKSAQIYDNMLWWDKAGRVRAKKNINKNITINVNQMIDQLRSGGLAFNYKCQNCGALIIFDKDSRSDALKFCKYCGSAIDITTINDLLVNSMK